MAPDNDPRKSELYRLSPSYENLVRVLETMNCGLVASDLQGNVAYMNPRMLSWLQYEFSEVVGQPAALFAVPEHAEILAQEMAAVRDGDVRARMTILRRKDTTTMPALFAPQRVLEDGEVAWTFSIVIDLGSVQTAKRIGVQEQPTPDGSLLVALEKIARQLRSMNTTIEMPLPKPDPLDHPALRELSPREREVLELLLQGERVPSIGEQLFISDHTVRNHLKSMYRKTGTGSQAELIRHVRSLN